MRNWGQVVGRGSSGFSFVWGLLSALGLAGLASACLVCQPCSAQETEEEGVGAILSGKASAADVGLPIYPGSKPHKEKSNDSEAARLGLWGGGSGFKLAVVKMETGASPEKVAAFYKKALSRYGRVLDCSGPQQAQAEAKTDDSSKTLTCGDDKPEKGGMLFKSGTQEKQHIVAVQPSGQGSLYQPVALGKWNSDHRN